MVKIIKKKHRLEKPAYIGKIIVSFTLCVNDEEKLFVDKKMFSVFENILVSTANNYGFDLIIYLFMPDHVHLIIQGKNNNSDCLKMINMFKQKTGYWLSFNDYNTKWQRDYFDHIIGNDKDLRNQVYYILNNPVRAGIVNDLKEYLFKGSTIMNLDEMEW